MALRSMSTAELRKELERREKRGGSLLKERDKVAARLAELDSELADLGLASGNGRRRGRKPGPKPGPKAGGARRGRKPGPKPGRGGRRRARNEMPLPDAIAAAMDKGAVVSPTEAAELVLANGFKTTSKNFNMMVSNALAKDSRFKRLSRGQYERVK